MQRMRAGAAELGQRHGKAGCTGEQSTDQARSLIVLGEVCPQPLPPCVFNHGEQIHLPARDQELLRGNPGQHCQCGSPHAARAALVRVDLRPHPPQVLLPLQQAGGEPEDPRLHQHCHPCRGVLLAARSCHPSAGGCGKSPGGQHPAPPRLVAMHLLLGLDALPGRLRGPAQARPAGRRPRHSSHQLLARVAGSVDREAPSLLLVRALLLPLCG
mmetsp:Transcript_20745/g.58362  ORF Transcript_20745/g.58362 Transcript_20745/m.58362 type:complete len:214 (+) Transcript_20745:304-945(+)